MPLTRTRVTSARVSALSGARCALRPGNVHSAEGWGDVLKPVVVRYLSLPVGVISRPQALELVPRAGRRLVAVAERRVRPEGLARGGPGLDNVGLVILRHDGS